MKIMNQPITAGLSRIARSSRLGLVATALGLLANPAPAQLAITVGNHFLRPNEANQVISLYVDNTSGSDVPVTGLNVFVQVADTGPASEGGIGSIDGPDITGLDIITDTIFGTVGNTGNDTLLWPSSGAAQQFARVDTETSGGAVNIGANTRTLLASVTVDTTGFSAVGTSWDFLLGTTLDGSTYYTGVPSSVQIFPTITEGALTIVPEPAAYSVGFGGLMLGMALFRRFNKKS